MTWQRSSTTSATSRTKAHARTLRRAMTEPEKRLWWHLRHRLPVEGSHFRRQVAIGPSIADVCCLSARLVVEVDGDQHGHDSHLIHDARRTAALEAQGFRVLRFTNAEVMRATDTVLDTILAGLPAPVTEP
ncbi:endonuclease domain-containing protein [Methylobacterium sp. JK268]